MYSPNDMGAMRPLEIEMLRTEIRDTLDPRGKLNRASGLLTVLPGDDWMKMARHTTAPRRLFGELWYEHELCILFADTNMGKSFLAVQLGIALANGQAIAPFAADLDRGLRLLYIDFELNTKQFELRYRDDEKGCSHNFGPRFFRAEFNPMTELSPPFKTYDHMLNSAIESAINKTHAEVLIIDNLTCLRSGTEKAADALPLMKHLKYLKTKFNLSILVLAHTPKRNPTKPITRNDLQGSKMLINFCDSSFAIGESHADKELRYLKQIKQRNTHEIYGAENVCLCKLVRKNWYLQYEFTGNARENDHLGRSDYVQARVKELSLAGYSQRQIGKALQVSKTTVCRVLKSG
jgi:RecA-family ATPase